MVYHNFYFYFQDVLAKQVAIVNGAAALKDPKDVRLLVNVLLINALIKAKKNLILLQKAKTKDQFCVIRPTTFHQVRIEQGRP